MRLYTNRIFTGQPKTLDAFIKEAAAKTQVKTASAAAPAVKTAEDDKKDKDGEMHVKMQPGDPCCGTDTGEIIEGDEKIKAAAETEVKVAEKDEADGVTHKTDPVGGTNTAKPEDKVYPGKKADAPAETKKVAAQEKKAEGDTPAGDKGDYAKVPNSGGRTHGPDACCGAPTKAGNDGSEGEKKEAKDAWSGLTAFANLKSGEKSKFIQYWRRLYPQAFADAMGQDK